MLKRKHFVGKRQQYRIAKKTSEDIVNAFFDDSSSSSSAFHTRSDPDYKSNDANCVLLSEVISTSNSLMDHECQSDFSYESMVNECNSISEHDSPKRQDTTQASAIDNPSHSVNFTKILSKWAVTSQIHHNSLNRLLKHLRTVPSLKDLPSDARTLLSSPRQLVFKDVSPGKYFHFGLERAVSSLLCRVKNINDIVSVEICVNIDGIPLTKSSGSQFYPILCNLYTNPRDVSVIGIYHGFSKPKEANELLKDFIKEGIEFTNNGFLFNNHSYPFQIKAFICDVPAQCFITYTIGHMGYDSCSKCYIKGKYCCNRICFPSTENLIKRTDSEFRQKSNERHHSGTSLLEKLPNFNMIDGLVLDYMHLICLGTVRKLLYLWAFDTQSGSKLSRRDIEQISDFLISQRSNVPCEFARKPRSLLEVKRWKATEFRQFLFYMGPVILKKTLPADNYKKNLSLFVATLILTSPKFVYYKDHAEVLMKYFVDTFKILYGIKNMSHNIHNMLHISEDVENMGVFDRFSAFPFENKLQQLKKLMRKGDNPLAQIVKRIHEIEKCEGGGSDHKPNFCGVKEHDCGPSLAGTNNPQYREFHFANFTLKISEPNNCCRLFDGSIVNIQNFATRENDIVLIGYKYLTKEDLFKHPCKSSDLDVFVTSNPGPVNIFLVEEVENKCVKLDYEDKYVTFPLLHTQN